MPEMASVPPRRPVFTIALTPQEIEEDLAQIISSMKRDGRKRKRVGTPPVANKMAGEQSGTSKEQH